MNRTREALSLWVADASNADLQPKVLLPERVRSKVRRVLAARRRAQKADDEARELLVETVRELTEDERMSVRDVAGLVHLSPQRIHQLTQALSRTQV